MNKGIQIRLTLLISMFFTLFLYSCKSTDKTGPVQYEYLQVERQGGGQLDFRIYPGQSRSNLYVYVSRSNFESVDKRLEMHIDENCAEAFDDYYRALGGLTPLNGKQKASKSLAGTWLYMRFVRGNREVEITNPELIQRFSEFEKLVREQLSGK